MYCRQCGTELNDTQAFCPKCGEKVDKKKVKIENHAWLLYSLVISTLLLAIAVTVACFVKDSSLWYAESASNSTLNSTLNSLANALKGESSLGEVCTMETILILVAVWATPTFGLIYMFAKKNLCFISCFTSIVAMALSWLIYEKCIGASTYYTLVAALDMNVLFSVLTAIYSVWVEKKTSVE